TGNNFTTPVLTASTTYYAQAKSLKMEKVNVPSPTIGTSLYITNAVGWGLRFTVNQPVTISSVKIKALNTAAATATMQIRITDLNDVVLYSGTNHSFPITATATEYVIP